MGTRWMASESTPLGWARSYLASLLLIIDLTSLVLASASVHGPVRFVTGLLLGVVVLGWSVVGLLPLEDMALLIGLSVAVSLSLLMLMVQALMAMGAWHLVGLQIAISILCAPSLVWQSRRTWMALWSLWSKRQ
jgi:hypothetical protein